MGDINAVDCAMGSREAILASGPEVLGPEAQILNGQPFPQARFVQDNVVDDSVGLAPVRKGPRSPRRATQTAFERGSALLREAGLEVHPK
eukprot:6832135-Alexandrium_andersonii.AAC.1